MLLCVQDLSIRFATEEGVVHAVNGVSLELDAAETLGIVGESGCGKSVTSLALMRLLPRSRDVMTRGRILFDGTDLLSLKDSAMRRLRGKDLAMVFQDPMTSLNPVLTTGRQLTETVLAHQRLSRTKAREYAVDLLRRVGIPEPEEAIRLHPHQLSGGMRQRVMIAMALALRPRLLIADEPTTALDVTIQAQVLELMRALTREAGTALILITHDLGVVASMTQRVAVMYAGFIVEQAPTGAIFSRPRHPYTIGLLHSIPRLDVPREQALIPIEGTPPDQLTLPEGCPFAPRCAWRLPVCWHEMPPLEAATGTRGEHRLACHNPASGAEAGAGQPLREGFVPAPPPHAAPATTG